MLKNNEKLLNYLTNNFFTVILQMNEHSFIFLFIICLYISEEICQESFYY